jgi:diguanylate cyclase (GGDEF)-like protein
MPAPTSETEDLGSALYRPGPQPGIRRVLAGLVAACLLPALVALAAMVVVNYRVQEAAVQNEAVMRARTMLLLLDGELEAIESGLHVLANSIEIASGDPVRMHDRLREAQLSRPVDSYVLLDAQGLQRASTFAAAGVVERRDAMALQMRPVFATGRPSLSGIFPSPATRNPVVALGVPVMKNDAVAQVLAATITPDEILKAMEPSLPDGWGAVVIDSGGRIVTRTRDAARFVGQAATPSLLSAIAGKSEGVDETVTKEGVKVLTAFSRSPLTAWTVAVGAPKAVLVASVYRSVALIAVGLLVALAIVLWFVHRVSRIVIQAVGSLIEPALALGGGRPVDLPSTSLRETDAVARAIHQASRMLARAQYHAYHDPLTSLRNRTLFDEMATRQIAQAYRDGAQLAILAIDLDGFKAVNDRHGHAAGDVVLQRVAARITGSLRGSDVVARRGGDEFSVLLVDVDGQMTRQIAEKLVDALSQPYPDVEPPVSASIGVARYPHDATTLHELLEHADEALYAAKNSGKGRVVGDF